MPESIIWTNEKRKLKELIPWRHNPREISKEEAKRLGDSLFVFGQIQTIAIGPNNELYDGHQRKLVWSILPKFGPEYEIDVRVSSRPLTEKERQQLVIFLHKGTEAHWDWGILSDQFEFDDLAEWGFDEETLNLNWEEESDEPEPPEAQVDKAEELQEKWQVETGQLWQIGEHRLICGDCRETSTWKRLLEAAGVDKVNGVFTSPPYAMQRAKQYGGVPSDKYVDWWEAVQANVKAHLADDGSFFVNIKPHCKDGERVLYVFDLVLAMKRRWGWRFVDELCWTKQAFPGGFHGRFKNAFEPIYHFGLLPASKIRWIGDAVKQPLKDSHYQRLERMRAGYRRPNTESRMDDRAMQYYGDLDGALPSNHLRINTTSTEGHGLQAAPFPVALPTFFIKAYSDKGDVWCDPFCGSGTTGIAAHNEGRRALMIEKLPKYCAVILERFSQLPGCEPGRVQNVR